jgi:DNA processing protein
VKPAFDPIQDFEFALCLTPGLGGSTISKIITRNAITGLSPQDFFRLRPETLVEEYGLSERSAQALSAGDVLRSQVADLKRRIGDKPVSIVTCGSPLYPRRVEEFCKNPPGFLVLYGNRKVLQTGTFAALASRGADSADLETIERTVEKGILEGKTLVTGTNTPTYQRAAVVPLRWGSPRILPLDRGIFHVFGESLEEEAFPAARLWRHRFDPLTDLAIGPFRPDDDFAPGHNKTRDELVFALSDELHIVRQTKGGNMEQLSLRAEKLGRKVVRL